MLLDKHTYRAQDVVRRRRRLSFVVDNFGMMQANAFDMHCTNTKLAC